MPGTSSSNESTKSSSWKAILAATLGMGFATVICMIAAILMLMYFSYGDEMWPILFKLKIGPGP